MQHKYLPCIPTIPSQKDHNFRYEYLNERLSALEADRFPKKQIWAQSQSIFYDVLGVLTSMDKTYAETLAERLIAFLVRPEIWKSDATMHFFHILGYLVPKSPDAIIEYLKQNFLDPTLKTEPKPTWDRNQRLYFMLTMIPESEPSYKQFLDELKVDRLAAKQTFGDQRSSSGAFFAFNIS